MFLINQLHVSNLIEFVSLKVAILGGGSKTCRTCISIETPLTGSPLCVHLSNQHSLLLKTQQFRYDLNI
jgi:hypothetical protein